MTDPTAANAVIEQHTDAGWKVVYGNAADKEPVKAVDCAAGRCVRCCQ